MEVYNEKNTTSKEGTQIPDGGSSAPIFEAVSLVENHLGSFLGGMEKPISLKRAIEDPFNQGKRSCISQEYEREQEEMKVQKSKPTQSFNLKTLTDPHSAYKGRYESYAKHYLGIVSNMIVKNSQEFTKFYFPGSMLTVAVYDAGTCNVQEVGGEQNILALFQKFSMYRKYNASLISVQPGLGQGASIIIDGTLGNLYQNNIKGFTMTLNLVNLRKSPYILNQTFIIR